MAIDVGGAIPAVSLKYLGEDGMKEITTEELFKGKKVVLFALPGAYTPTCSARHLPGFVDKAAEIKGKGVDSIICLSVNDPFVMKAWGKDANAGDAVFLLPDGNCTLTKALGLDFDGSAFGLGTRSQRYAAVVEDGVITHLAVEKAGAFEVSSAEAVLKVL